MASFGKVESNSISEARVLIFLLKKLMSPLVAFLDLEACLLVVWETLNTRPPFSTVPALVWERL